MMEKNTINGGMSFEEFFKELSKDIPTSSLDNGCTYLSIDEVEKRVHGFVKPSTYNFTCSLPQLIEVGDRKSFIVIGRLELLDDAGNIVCVREVPGGADISHSQNDANHPATELKTTIASAQSSAFKGVWDVMGLASGVELSFKNGKKASAKTQSSQQKCCEVVFTSNLSYSNNGTPMISGNAVVEGKKVELKIFQEGLEYFTKHNKAGKVLPVEEVIKCLTENYGSSKARKTILGYGYFNVFKGRDQFILQKGGE